MIYAGFLGRAWGVQQGDRQTAMKLKDLRRAEPKPLFVKWFLHKLHMGFECLGGVVSSNTSNRLKLNTFSLMSCSTCKMCCLDRAIKHSMDDHPYLREAYG